MHINLINMNLFTKDNIFIVLKFSVIYSYLTLLLPLIFVCVDLHTYKIIYKHFNPNI